MRSPFGRRAHDLEAAVPGPTARSRRAFARRQWARRWLAWKYVVALVLLTVLVGATIWTVFFSSFLAVQGVEVKGATTVSVREIRNRAAVPEGQPLARVDLDRIKYRVQALDKIASADVTRQWPDKVLVTVTERVAVAVVEIGGRFHGLDEQGHQFGDYARVPAGLPRVQTGSDTRTDALAEAARVIAALPGELAATVDHVEVETVDQISLVLRDGRTVVWGSAEKSDEKALVLAALLQHPARTYDVSVPEQPTTAGTP